MQIYDVTVRFSRTIQVREYEPASAEVTVKAQLSEGEAADQSVADAFKLISDQVHLALGLPANTTLPKRVNAQSVTATAAAPTPKPAGAAAPKAEAPKAAAPKAEAPKPAAKTNDDIPGEAAPAAKTTAAAAKPNDDIPGEAPTKPAAPAQQTAAATGEFETLTAAELSKWIGEQVRLGKITSNAIVGLYPKFGISRFMDLKPERCGEAKADIQKIIDKVIDGNGAV